MTSGARRGELCAIHWGPKEVWTEDKSEGRKRRVPSYLDLDNGVLVIRTSIAHRKGGRFEKLNKTHQRRRIALDTETIEVLRELRARSEKRAKALDMTLPPDAYVFSLAVDGSAPPPAA